MKHSRPSWLRKVALVEQWLLVSALGTIVLLSFMQILLRNFWDTSVYWFDPMARHLVLVVMVIGGARAADRLSHLRIDLISAYLPSVWKRIVNRISWLGAMVVTLILAFAGLNFLMLAYQWNDGTALTRGLLWSLPVGFGLIAFHFAIGIVWPEPPPEDKQP